MKRKIEIKYFILVFLITSIFYLSMMSFFIKKESNYTFMGKIIKDGIYYLSYALEYPVNKIDYGIKKIKELNNIYEKYESLKEEAEKTSFMTSKYHESLKVIHELESMLDLNSSLLETEYINATVIGRNINFWHDKITIDKGTKNGIKENQAVVTKDGLIGIILSASYTTSDVKLLTTDDVNQKISIKVRVGDKELYGLLTGYDKKTKEFTIEGIASNIEVPIESIVTTTGFGGNLPSGILIGQISGMQKDHFDLERTFTVKSPVDFDGVLYVTVLKRKDNA